MTNNQLKELENTISIIYNKNLLLLESNYGNIYKKILKLEREANFNYSLSFIDNHFELLDVNSTPIYNCDPFFDAQSRVKDLDKAGAFSIIKKDNKYTTLHNDYDIEAMNLLNDYIDIINNKTIMNKDKFIFLGSILGVHINDIAKELKSKSYLIIENNIEVFRLSMFLTDYTELFERSRLFLSINENSKEKEKTINNFLNYLPSANHQIRFDLSSELDIPLIEEISKVFISKNKINYPYSEYLLSLSRGLSYFNTFKRLLDFNTKYKILSSYNILFIGGGFSLKNNIKFLKEKRNDFLIVCVAAAVKVLAKYDIIPDIIITSDSSNIISEQFNIEKKYYFNSIIFTSNKTHEKVISLFNPNSLFFFNDSLEIFPNTGVNTGANVGNIGYSIILKLGANNIYLLGFDACIDNLGNTHSNKTTNIKLEKFDVSKNDKISSESHFIEVKGNFKEKVSTTMHYKSMIDSFSEIKDLYRINAYNLSKEGAFLPGINPIEIDKITLANTNTVNLKHITKDLIKICKTNLTVIEENELLINKKLINLFENINLNNIYKEFLLIHSKNENNLIIKILKDYFDLVLPYYNYALEVNKDKANELFKEHWQKIILYLKNNI